MDFLRPETGSFMVVPGNVPGKAGRLPEKTSMTLHKGANHPFLRSCKFSAIPPSPAQSGLPGSGFRGTSKKSRNGTGKNGEMPP
ncbi:hypothetical protein OCT51_17410 [Halomonas sp. LR3S48]|uniref:hypothetical protein n=1 Tax=Halomonadaceae TaxID=28256 RepID=UPI0021E42F40|nr:hypothetical protein [Halomonas sp. LR3S48]UYG02950.1 hypothetical protein OCT51_17410 [Halomonas sp. LR3S48]